MSIVEATEDDFSQLSRLRLKLAQVQKRRAEHVHACAIIGHDPGAPPQDLFEAEQTVMAVWQRTLYMMLKRAIGLPDEPQDVRERFCNLCQLVPSNPREAVKTDTCLFSETCSPLTEVELDAIAKREGRRAAFLETGRHVPGAAPNAT